MARITVDIDDGKICDAIRGAVNRKDGPVPPEHGDDVVPCPYCGEGAYAHLGNIVVNQDGFVVEVSQDGPSCRREQPNGRRGAEVSINYACECGHLFRHIFWFHKGQTYCGVRGLGDYDIANDSIPTLWRD